MMVKVNEKEVLQNTTSKVLIDELRDRNKHMASARDMLDMFKFIYHDVECPAGPIWFCNSEACKSMVNVFDGV